MLASQLDMSPFQPGSSHLWSIHLDGFNIPEVGDWIPAISVNELIKGVGSLSIGGSLVQVEILSSLAYPKISIEFLDNHLHKLKQDHKKWLNEFYDGRFSLDKARTLLVNKYDIDHSLLEENQYDVLPNNELRFLGTNSVTTIQKELELIVVKDYQWGS